MYLNLIKKLAIINVVFLLFTAQMSFAADLEYQERGDRWEGIKRSPISASTGLELISALAYSEKEKNLSAKQLKLKFYVQHSSEIDIVIQELNPEVFYWMDKVREGAMWKNGLNEYQWSNDVIQSLKLRLSDLGVIARFKKADNDNKNPEQIIPVLFYHSKPPSVIKRYLFTFKANESAKLLKYSIYKDGGNAPVISEPLLQSTTDEPFVVSWDCSKADEGLYELIVTGSFKKDDVPIHYPLKFYHKRGLN